MKRILVLALLLPALATQAQDVWRCGPGGRTFSDRPCADGKPMQMASLADIRSAAEVQSAREVAARERRLTESLRQERLARQQVAGSGSRGPARVQHGQDRDDVRPLREAEDRPQQRESRRAAAVDGPWRAIAPSSPRAKD